MMQGNTYMWEILHICSIPYKDKRDMLIHAATGLTSEAGEDRKSVV